MKLLFVEDDEILSRTVKKGLQKKGYAVDCAFDGEEALYLYQVNQYDLIILDLNLPKMDGIDVLREIRQTDPYMRIIILSARVTVEDKIQGLDCGCNDYMTKPFDFAELEARIRGLLRCQFEKRSISLCCGDLHIDTATKSTYIKGVSIPLTKKEYSILEYLMFHSDRVVSAEELIEHVWDSQTDLFSNTFKFHLHSLRKKLIEKSGVDYILTIRGQGYRVPDVKGD